MAAKLSIPDRVPKGAVLVKTLTVIPEIADPVWLASVPRTVIVAFGVAIWGLIPVMEIARVCEFAATVPDDRCSIRRHGEGPRGRQREDRADGHEQHGDQRAEGTNDGAHGWHVMTVRRKGMG